MQEDDTLGPSPLSALGGRRKEGDEVGRFHLAAKARQEKAAGGVLLAREDAGERRHGAEVRRELAGSPGHGTRKAMELIRGTHLTEGGVWLGYCVAG